MFKLTTTARKFILLTLILAPGLLMAACQPATAEPAPTGTPQPQPTDAPTTEPTAEPTVEPTAEPTAEPTDSGDDSPQYITIGAPADGTSLDPAGFTVSGEGGALFEGTVAVEVLSVDGAELAEQATIIDAPDAGTGGEGPWTIDLSVDYSGEATIHAFSQSARDGSIVAEDSVTVTFE